MSVDAITPTGGEFNIERLIVFRRGEHVVVYRTIEELQEMLKKTWFLTTSSQKIEIEFLTTAVEQKKEES